MEGVAERTLLLLRKRHLVAGQEVAGVRMPSPRVERTHRLVHPRHPWLHPVRPQPCSRDERSHRHCPRGERPHRLLQVAE